MPTLQGSLLIKAPADSLFWFSQDYDRRLEWDSYLRVARLTNGRTKAQVGAEAFCESRKGIGMTVRYLSFRPPSQVAMEMTAGPWVFRKFSGSWRFIALGPDQTNVIFRYHFTPIGGRMGAWVLTWFLKWLLQADIKHRLEDLRNFAETPSNSLKAMPKTITEI